MGKRGDAVKKIAYRALQLLEVERDLRPTLRGVYRGNAIRPGFAAHARARVFSD